MFEDYADLTDLEAIDRATALSDAECAELLHHMLEVGRDSLALLLSYQLNQRSLYHVSAIQDRLRPVRARTAVK